MPNFKMASASLGMFRINTDLRLAMTVPVLTVLLLAVIWGATFNVIRTDERRTLLATAASLADLTDTYEAQLARNLGGIEQTLKTIEYAVQVNGTATALAAMQRQDLLPSALIFEVKVIDTRGTVMDSTAATATISVAAQRFFIDHRIDPSGTVQVTGTAAQKGQRALVQFSKRLVDKYGKFAGVATIAVEPAYFTSGYDHSRLGDWGMLALANDSGTVLALRVGDRQVNDKQRNVPLSASAGAALATWDGVKRYISARRVGRFHLTAVVGLSATEQSAVYASRRSSSIWQAAAASALLLALVAILWIWTRQGARTRRSIRLAQQTYEAASETNQDAFFVLHSILDKQGQIVDFRISAANLQAERITGVSRNMMQHRRLSNLLPEAVVNGVFEKLVHVVTVGGVHEKESKNTIAEFKAGWLHEQLVGVDGGVVAILRDVSERKAAEAKILHMAQHDALTGLPNRALLQARLIKAIDHAERRNSMVVVAFIDLDNFKIVNDGLGHGAGDVLLSEIAGRMNACLRRQDTLGRFGGDEFVIILPVRQNTLDASLTLLDRVGAAVCQTVDIEGYSVEVSCSIGVAVFPRDGASADQLLVRADVAMYSAKAAGKNRHRFYSETMNASAEHKLALFESLRTAIRDRQFRVAYQPKTDVRSGKVFGMEALIRWHHPEFGIISPAEFIPLAEESGLIVPIGRWVMEEACRQSVAWQSAGFAPIVMSVNVSARQFDDVNLLVDVNQALLKSGLAPALLEIEVTESLIMRDMKGAVAKMQNLKRMGLQLSIDDFGTGYSSLSSLKSFPITTLKIDKSFIHDIDRNPDDQAIGRAIIALAHQLGLRVIAEGVETMSQFDFLRDNACDEVQGFLFGRPADPTTAESSLQRQSDTVPPTSPTSFQTLALQCQTGK